MKNSDYTLWLQDTWYLSVEVENMLDTYPSVVAPNTQGATKAIAVYCLLLELQQALQEHDVRLDR